MAQRDPSKAGISFIDDKTVLLSVGDLTASAADGGQEIDEDAPEVRELKDSLLMVLRQVAGPKLH